MPNQKPPKGPKHGKGLGKRQQLLVFGGAAAAVGVFALAKRNSSSGDSGSGTAASTTGVQGTYDSTANDVYNSLENQLGALQDQIKQIAAGQGTSKAGTGSGPTTKPPTKKPPVTKPPAKTPKPKPKPKPAPKPKPKPKPAPKLTTVTVKHNQTLAGIAKSHGESLGQLLKDNPTYTKNPKYHGGNSIWAGDKVKVR